MPSGANIKKKVAALTATKAKAEPEAGEISTPDVERPSIPPQGKAAPKQSGGSIDMRTIKRSNRQYRLHTKISQEARERLVEIAIAQDRSLSEVLEDAILSYKK